jgi:hypothetical protein
MVFKRGLIRLLPLFLALLSSCHSEYLSSNYQVVPVATVCADNSSYLFVLRSKAFLQASGLSRMPDGGRPKYILNKLSLYRLNSTDNLQEMYRFSDLENEKVNLEAKILCHKDSILLSIYPTTEWEFYAKNVDSEQRLNQLNKLGQRYTRDRVYLVDQNNLKLIDFDMAAGQDKVKKEYSTGRLSRELESLPLIELGFDLLKLYPKEAEAYIDECIYLKNDSPMTRRAIIEQVIAALSEDEINALLKAMDDYANSLSGLEKTEYETYSKDTYENIKALL